MSRRELTNLGIMKSPGTVSMILSMYYPAFEGQQCIGYVGAGVYASHLMDSLLNLDIKGLPDSEYVFLNVDTGVYLYHEDDALLNTETTDAGYQEIIRRIQADGGTQASTYSYRDDCIQSIRALMDEITAASVQQSEMILLVENGIKEISAVVQDNSAAAEKSASVSKELSQQARTLNSLISSFRIRK